MKVSKVVLVEVPCPLCHSSVSAGPYECKRCGLEVCFECIELSSLGLDRNRTRILCKPCVSKVEAEVALESLAGAAQAPTGIYDKQQDFIDAWNQKCRTSPAAKDIKMPYRAGVDWAKEMR